MAFKIEKLFSVNEVHVNNRPLQISVIEEIANVSAAWLFDESTGTTIYDSSGNSMNSISDGGSTISSGKFGNARSFATNPIKFASTSMIGTGNQPFTISSWMYIDAFTLGTYTMALRLKQDTECVAASLWYHNDSYTGGSAEYTFTACFRGYGQYAAKITSNLVLGGWNHIVVSFDGSNKSTYKLYINGVEVTHRYGTWGIMGGSTNENSFGVDSSNGSDIISTAKIGKYDQTFITTQVLTPQTILNLYNNKIITSGGSKVQIVSI